MRQEQWPPVTPEEAMQKLQIAKTNPDPFLFDYAMSTRALEVWTSDRLSDLPDPKTVQYADHSGEYTALLLGATNNRVQQLDSGDRSQFEDMLHLARVVYSGPQNTL